MEFEVTARPIGSIDIFATLGITSAIWRGTSAGGADVAQNKIPFTPDYTALFGAQVNRAVNASFSLYGRGERGAVRRL